MSHYPENNLFVISGSAPGTIWLNQVSLFPPTYNGRPNGNRIDLMQMLAALKPAFLRLPGGNYLEGNDLPDRFAWESTIGDISQRPGHQSPWGYRSSDGLGLLEFLEWCEDLHMQPVLGVFAGYTLDGAHVNTGADLQPYVQEALDEIEYVTGDAATTWGARRIADGHPAPFPLTYVEVGNEDLFDTSSSYNGRFTQFYDAIKARYPSLQIIATTAVSSRTPDVLDDHYYRSAQGFESDVHHYDNYDRSGPKIFVGEFASTEGLPTSNMDDALGEAAWWTGLERNSDLVIMAAHAPLFDNVSPYYGFSQTGYNLIGYDPLSSYGSPAYYVQQMFSRYHGDIVLPATLSGGAQLSESVTRDSTTGTIIVKVVNAASTEQSVQISLAGVPTVVPTGLASVLTSASSTDTNTLTDPVHIVPALTTVGGLSQNFSYTFAPLSVTVLQIQTQQGRRRGPF